MPVLKMKDAEQARNAITIQQQKQIRLLYRNAAKEVAKMAKELQGRTNISSIMRIQYLNDLEAKLKLEVRKVSKVLKAVTEEGVREVVQEVIKQSAKNLAALGFSGVGLLSNVPSGVVSSILTGNVYEDGWNLSKRIWGAEQKTLQDIHTVIATGVAENRSVYDIAKDLEKYVDPRAAKTWDWNKVYPHTSRQVDYNAQRLARTLTQHAFQQATKACNNPNPFVGGYIWHSAMIHGRTCSTCMDMDGQFFKKDEVPFDHPQGLCTIMPHVEQDLDLVAEQIADWTEAPTGTYPEIDDFYVYITRR